MSLHVEWIHTDYLATEVVPAGSQIGADGEVGPGYVALVLHYDEAVVIEGTKASVAAKLRRALEQVERIEDGGPIPRTTAPNSRQE